MFLLVVCLLVLLYTGQWPFAALLVGVYFYHTRPRSQPGPEGSLSDSGPGAIPPPPVGTAGVEFTDKNVADLALLRLELERLLADGVIDRAFHDHTLGSIDTLLSQIVGDLGAVEGEVRLDRRESAWELLIRHGLVPPGPPPWRHEPQAEMERVGETEPELELEPLPEPSYKTVTIPAAVFISDPFAVPPKTQTPVFVPPLSAESTTVLTKTPAVPPPAAPTPVQPVAAESKPASGSATIAATQTRDSPPSSEPKAGLDETVGYAWQPKSPSALERALEAVSGWPTLIVPFLVQNIGWFIGGLCVVAGSVFLVSYTTGFAKALTVSLILCAYTLFILWGGYQLRRRRPELETSSSVLLALGVFLVPLNIAASVRVITAGQHLPGLIHRYCHYRRHCHGTVLRYHGGIRHHGSFVARSASATVSRFVRHTIGTAFIGAVSVLAIAGPAAHPAAGTAGLWNGLVCAGLAAFHLCGAAKNCLLCRRYVCVCRSCLFRTSYLGLQPSQGFAGWLLQSVSHGSLRFAVLPGRPVETATPGSMHFFRGSALPSTVFPSWP